VTAAGLKNRGGLRSSDVLETSTRSSSPSVRTRAPSEPSHSPRASRDRLLAATTTADSGPTSVSDSRSTAPTSGSRVQRAAAASAISRSSASSSTAPISCRA
jgi:hypothetical protein